MSRFRPPVRRSRSGYLLNLSEDEVDVLRRVLGQLRQLLEGGDDPGALDDLTRRLFPTAYTHDEELEAEYQRLMREELVASRVASIDIVDEILAGGGHIDESQLTSFMQSLNAVRLVLGTMLDVGEDDDDPQRGDSAEHHLYAYLSWLLEWTVRALSGR